MCEYNGTGPSSGHALVDDLAQARVAWRSEEATPDSWIWSRSASPAVGGGYSSPILMDGRPYVAYYVPSGTLADTV